MLTITGTAIAVTNCGNTGGTICCGAEAWLPFRYIQYSSWSGNPGLHYYARRRNDSFELTYNHYQYNGGAWFYDHGSHQWRGTGLYRGGDPLMDYAVSQAGDGNCFP